MPKRRPHLQCVTPPPPSSAPDARAADYLLAFGPVVLLLLFALTEC